MSEPVQFSITLESAPGLGEFMRLEARDHLSVVARFDMSLPDWAKATAGHEVLAAYSGGGRHNA